MKLFQGQKDKFLFSLHARERGGVQGDIESVAAKSPKELTTLFEHISGSEAFRADYNKLSAAKEVRRSRVPFSCLVKCSATGLHRGSGTSCFAVCRMHCLLCNKQAQAGSFCSTMPVSSTTMSSLMHALGTWV